MALFEAMIGVWNVTEHHYNERGKEVSTAKGTEEIHWILGKHAVRRSYTTSYSGGRAYHAIGTLTWNSAEKKYRGTWFDDVSTSGPTMVSGVWNKDSRTMEYLLESQAANGSTIRYKVVDKFVDEKHRVATTYFVRDAQLLKRLEVYYNRPKPCPAARSLIFLDEPG